MSVKRYGYHRVNKWGFDHEMRFDGDDLDAKYVLATDYDELRAVLANENPINGGAWKYAALDCAKQFREFREKSDIDSAEMVARLMTLADRWDDHDRKAWGGCTNRHAQELRAVVSTAKKIP